MTTPTIPNALPPGTDQVKATRDLARRYEDKTNALIDHQSVPLGDDAPAGSQVTRPRPKNVG
jgi:hypothetical protein